MTTTPRQRLAPTLVASAAARADAATRASRSRDRERRPGRSAAHRGSCAVQRRAASARGAAARRVAAPALLVPAVFRLTTCSPHALPAANSASGSTSSSQPMKCCSDSSSVEPKTAARPASNCASTSSPPRSSAPRAAPRPLSLLHIPCPSKPASPDGATHRTATTGLTTARRRSSPPCGPRLVRPSPRRRRSAGCVRRRRFRRVRTRPSRAPGRR